MNSIKMGAWLAVPASILLGSCPADRDPCGRPTLEGGVANWAALTGNAQDTIDCWCLTTEVPQAVCTATARMGCQREALEAVDLCPNEPMLPGTPVDSSLGGELRAVCRAIRETYSPGDWDSACGGEDDDSTGDDDSAGDDDSTRNVPVPGESR